MSEGLQSVVTICIETGFQPVVIQCNGLIRFKDNAGNDTRKRHGRLLNMVSGDTPCPGDFIRKELESRGWTQLDLAEILNRTPANLNDIIQGKRALLPEMARALGEALETGPEVWMSRESAYRLSLADPQDASIRDRARLYEMRRSRIWKDGDGSEGRQC